MHHYWAKLAVMLAVVIGLNFLFEVSVWLPISGTERRKIPVWLQAVLELFETQGWTLVVAIILAAVWQIAERH